MLCLSVLILTLLFNSGCTTSKQSQVYCPDFRSVKSAKTQGGKYVLKSKTQRRVKVSKRKVDKADQSQKYARQQGTANNHTTGLALSNNPLLQNAKHNKVLLVQQITKNKIQNLVKTPLQTRLQTNVKPTLRLPLKHQTRLQNLLDDTDKPNQKRLKTPNLKKVFKKKGDLPKITRDKIDPNDPYRYAKLSEIFMYITLGSFVVGLILSLVGLGPIILTTVTFLAAIATLVLGIMSMKREGDNRVARLSLWVSGIYLGLYTLLFLLVLVLILALSGAI